MQNEVRVSSGSTGSPTVPALAGSDFSLSLSSLAKPRQLKSTSQTGGTAVDCPTVALSMHPPRAQTACEWLVVDPQGVPILASARDGFSIALKKGWQLVLLERDSAASPWRIRRRSHIACALQRPQAYHLLEQAAAMLTRQGMRDRALGLPTEAVPDGFPSTADTGRELAKPSAWRDGLVALQAWWKRQLQRLRTEYWCIGVIDAPIHQILEGDYPRIRWMTQPEWHGYWADPFGMPGRDDLLAVEYLDQHTGLGHLETIRLDESGKPSSREKITLRHRGHASFPAIFELDGRRLGLAETALAGCITLHEVDAHGRWVEQSDLVVGVAAADPVLFKHEQHYWLAYTDLAMGAMDNLCLMYADSLDGPWQPHANNPVKVDITGSRMAGRPFVHKGELYRPAQDCLKCYGAAVVIYRVDQLNPTQFVETPVRRVDPDLNSHLPHGLHTLSAWGNRTLVDAKVEQVNPVDLLRKLRERSRRARRKPKSEP